MFSQVIQGLGNRIHKGGWDLQGCEPSCTITEKTVRVGTSHIFKANWGASSTHTSHSFSPLRLLFWTTLFIGARGQLTDPFPAQFELSSLDGTNDFIVNGEAANDYSGYSVSSAGDMNGDGLSDLVLGAYKADPSGKSSAGKSYVIFGTRTPISGGIIDLSTLNGSNGFILNGEAGYGYSGISVSSAGDLNGDGLSDLLIGAYGAGPTGKRDAGKSYVIFGTRTPISGGMLELSSLNGSNGFIVNGEAASDYSGRSVSSAGDMNGDGLSDLVIGAYGADPLGKSRAGKSYVIFGTRTPISGGMIELSTLNGSNGFIVHGEAAGDNSGYSVSSAGDVNGDGLSDLLIGANDASPSGKNSAGKSYVIFGTRTPISGGVFDLSTLNSSNGFIVNGEVAGDNSGRSVSSAGDVNGDGLSDLVIGAPDAGPSGRSGTGKSYVIFGTRTPISGGVFDLSTLNGSNGFIVNGEAVGDDSGSSVSSAGDVNGDGISDLVIGAPDAGPSGRSGTGKSYVIFGTRTPISGGVFDLSTLNGSNGFIVNGEAAGDESGSSVSSAGDVNGDGISDLVIGADKASPSGKSLAGKSYVIFGRNQTISPQTPTTPSAKTAPNIFPTLLSIPASRQSQMSSIATNPSSQGETTQQPSLPSTSTPLLPPPQPSVSSSLISSLLISTSLTLSKTSFKEKTIDPLHTRFITSNPATLPNVLKEPPSSSSPYIIGGLVAAVAALACCVFGCVVVYVKKRSHTKTPNHDTSLKAARPDPEAPAGYADIGKIRAEMQSARVDNDYAIIATGQPNNNYKEWPKEEAAHSTNQYDQVNLGELNAKMDQYDDAKKAVLHANYDELPPV